MSSEMSDAPPTLTMYVESRKAVTTFYRPSRTQVDGAGNPSSDVAPTGDTMEGGAAQFFLSDDQARALALAEDIAKHRGYRIEVKDIARIGRLERIVTEHLRNVTNFPVLVSAEGHRLEGADLFTEERLCEMMPAETRHPRAFTYLKIRGGNFEALRRTLLHFPEVRELHFLTGDWDAFLVLQFDGEEASKRRILEFVTHRIRGMDEVIDTSTLVPEVSVTKFPL